MSETVNQNTLRSAPQDTPEEVIEGKPERKSQATILVELASDVELFHTPEGEPYATVDVGEHYETWPLKSSGFRDWLMRRFHEAEGKSPSTQGYQDAIGVLNGQARFDGETREVYTRVAEHEGAIYVDLCDAEWRAVCITADGWRVVDSPPVKFRRTRGMLALPEPERGGSIGLLRRIINVTDEQLPLVLAWLVAAYRPNRPFPLLALHGEQGSAKSTTARVLRALIDPNKAALRSEPRNTQDLMIAATNGWLIALDNLSHVQTWLSDALCRLSTGGGFAARELYANNEEVLFDAMRPVLLNGIEELATRSDLLDRALVLNLPAIPEERRRSEADVWREFEASRPLILGALLDAVSAALRNVESVRLPALPRMADFALWATAAETALGMTEGAFLRAYTSNRRAANDLALEAAPVASAIEKLVERETVWTGTASELLAEVNLLTDEDVQHQRGWPKSPQAVSGALRRLAPNLRASGINVVVGAGREGGTGRRLIRLERRRDSSSHSSHSSQEQFSQGFARDVSDNGHNMESASSHENAFNNALSDDCDERDDAGQDISSLTDEIEEMAARLEYDEHLPREEAERRAREHYS